MSNSSAQAPDPDGDLPRSQYYTPEERERILQQQQQQRLLYLRHASKCTYVNGDCPHGYLKCRGMKALWRHIALCRRTHCEYPHCVSSRYVLSHYHKCHDDQCRVCAPVREIVRTARARQTQKRFMEGP